MLQVHDIIENLPNEEKFDLVKRYLTVFNAGNDGACFDFGDTDKLDNKICTDIVLYAHELAQHKLLKLPYNPVYYSWSSYDSVYGAFVFQEKDASDLSEKVNVIFVFGGKKPFRYAGFGTVAISNFGKEDLTGDLIPISIEGKVSDLVKDAVTSSDEWKKELYQLITYYVLLLTALIESPHTKTRVMSVGEKLNKKRGKRGLPQIMPFHTVYFEVDGKEYNTDGTSRGTGAQKRMHWRRGHIRHLSGGKITHVRPCLVGALGTDAHVAKPAYSMKQRGNVA